MKNNTDQFYFGGAQIFFNIVFFTLLLIYIFSCWFGITIGICCLVWACSNARRVGKITVDKENNTISFPSIYKYSCWKNIVGIILPLFQTMSIVTINLSDLRRVSSYNSGNKSFVELFLKEDKIIILRFPDNERAGKLVEELKEVKSDLYCDNFYSGRTIQASVIRFLIIAGCIICVTTFQLLTWWDNRIWTPDSPLNKTMRSATTCDLILGPEYAPHNWQCVSLTRTGKFKKATFANAVFKDGDRTENVELIVDNHGIIVADTNDLIRFRLKISLEDNFRKSLKEKNAGTFNDLQIIHLKGNKYLGILTYKVNNSEKEKIMIIENSSNEIKWKTIPSLPFIQIGKTLFDM
ncbi:MAG: hypothetical protein J6W00_03520 [Lentisphaeria bacterium]|nr:hypothetical protein [Lentisphaeria bacterium]